MQKKTENKSGVTKTVKKTVADEKPKREEPISKKKKLNEYTVENLLLYSQAVKAIIEKYEKVAKNYDNRIDNNKSVLFHKYVNLYNEIILEIERKLSEEIEF